MNTGRPRQGQTRRRSLPSYVYFSKGRWIWREYVGAGKLGKEVRLHVEPDATDAEIWAAYNAIVDRTEKTGSLDWLCDQYLKSKEFRRKAVSTRREHKRYKERICGTKLRNGGLFGTVRARQLTPGAIRRYMDKRAEEAPIAANRELEFLKVVFSFGVERDYLRSNPARAVKAQPERHRTRYVTDDEYRAVYDRAPKYVQIAMEFAYLCRLRRCEIIGPDIKDIDPDDPPKYTGVLREHILEEGLRVLRAKESKEQIIEWSPRLERAVEDAKALPGAISTQYLLHNKKGQRIRKRAFNSAWRRTMAKAKKEKGIESFTFHDLKAKGVSDFEGDKAKASGHKSLKMVQVYDRKIEIVASTK